MIWWGKCRCIWESVNIVSLTKMWMRMHVAQSCPTLCDPMDCSLPGFSIHGILQARILEWVIISFSRGSSQPWDWTWVSRIGGRHFNLWATREALMALFLQAIRWTLLGFSFLTRYIGDNTYKPNLLWESKEKIIGETGKVLWECFFYHVFINYQLLFNC